MRTYLRHCAPDALWCFVAGFSLARIVFAAFDSPDPLVAHWGYTAMAAAGITALMFLFNYNRKTALAGAVCWGLGLCAAGLLLHRSGGIPAAGRLDESPGLFWIVALGAPSLVFLLSWTRRGTLALLLVGAFMTATFGFLEYPVSLPCYMLFLISVAGLLLYRTYQAGLLRATAGTVRTGRYILQSLVLTLLVLGGAAGIYYGIIAPLNPDTEDLKLITRLESLEIVEKLGISRKTEIPTEDLSTVNENDLTQSTNDTPPPATPELEEGMGEPEAEPSFLPVPTPDQEAEAISYEDRRPGRWIWIVAAGLLALALPFLLRAHLRRRWERRLLLAGPTDAAVALYEYMMDRLRFAGLHRPDTVTLEEFMAENAPTLAQFAQDDCDFALLTRQYQRVVYGCKTLEEAEARPFWTVYGAFRKNLRVRLGWFHYALRFFRI